MRLEARPFLRWAGGKTQLLPQLFARVPENFQVYHEPFLGGGALFFALGPGRARLSDANRELVHTYQVAAMQIKPLMRELVALARGHETRGLAHYLEVRSQVAPPTRVAEAARMIYLNKMCFNGLYRVNRKGQCNVPMGKWKTLPKLFEEDNLIACSRMLRQEDVLVGCSDFRSALKSPREGDFVYLDPPYVPLTKTASFTRYTKEGFGPDDQKELAKLARGLKDRGVKILLSNAGNKTVRELYPEPLFKVEEVAAARKISCKSRVDVVEYLIS